MQPSPAAAVFRDNVFDLVLGGGGVKGLSHAGLLLAAYERGVTFGDVDCVSIGTLVGVMFVNGHPVQTLADTFMAELDRFGRAAFNGLFTLAGAGSVLRHGGAVDVQPFFSSLVQRYNLKTQPNLKIIAARWRRGFKPYVFDGVDYDLTTAMTASCAMPPFVKPVTMEEQGRKFWLVDGGLWHPAPSHFCKRTAIISRLGLASARPVRRLGLADTIIHFGEMTQRPIKDWFEAKPPRHHILVHSGMDGVATFSFNLHDQTLRDMVRHGYERASRAFDQMERQYRGGVAR